MLLILHVTEVEFCPSTFWFFWVFSLQVIGNESLQMYLFEVLVCMMDFPAAFFLPSVFC